MRRRNQGHPAPPQDVYTERAREAKAAQRAAAEIARTIPIEGLSDPGYIANIIEGELKRFEHDPNAPLIETPPQVSPDWWRGKKEHFTGWPYEDLIDATDIDPPAGADPATVRAARAATMRIAWSYATKIRPQLSEFLEWAPYRIAEHVTAKTRHTRIAGVEKALREIQTHRRAIGMPPLDPQAAGWTEEDVIHEAERIRRLNPRATNVGKLKRRLMR